MLVSLQVAALIVLQFPRVQTAIGQKVVGAVSENINGNLSVGNIYIVFFNRVIVKDVALVSTDKTPLLDSLKANYGQSDTLLACKKLSVTLDPVNLLKLDLKLNTVALTDGVFNLQNEEERLTNLDRIFNLQNDTPKDTTDEGSLNLLANTLKLNNFRFTFNTPDRFESEGDSIINFSNLDVRKIFINISDVHLKEDTLYACVNNVTGVDKSGFTIRALRGNVRVSGTETLISDLYLADKYTECNAQYFYMKYESPKDLSDFTQKVVLGANFKDAYLNFHTIGRMTPTLYNSNLAFYINGEVSGPVCNLRTNKLVVTSESGHSFIETSARIIGLPNVERTMAVAEVKRSSTTCADIATIVASINNTPKIKFLENLSPSVSYRFKGSLMGLLDDFVAKGEITSIVGKIDTDLLFRNEPDGSRFDGTLASHNLDLGKVLSNKLLGEVSMKADLNAFFPSGKDGMDVSIDSVRVSKLGFNDYDYSNIFAQGHYTEKNFNGTIICHDPNLDFIFQGLFSFLNDSKNNYDFQAYVPYANLAALNFDKRYPVSELSFSTTAKFTTMLDDYMNGRVDIKNATYRNNSGDYKIGTIKLQSLQSNNVYTASLDAPFAKAQYSGPAPLNQFVHKIAHLAVFSKTNNFFNKDTSVVYNNGNYRFVAQTFNTMNICQMLVPGLYIMDSTRVDVNIDRKNNLRARAVSGRLAMNANYLKNFNLQVDASADSASKVRLFSENIRFAGMRMDSSVVNVNAFNNTVDAGFRFKNDSTDNNRADILTRIDLLEGKKTQFNLLEGSGISLEGENWRFTPAKVEIADSAILVDNFNIRNGEQEFSLAGNISRYEPDTLNFGLRDFDIGIFNLFLRKSFDFKGLFSGNGVISDLYRSPKVFFDITGDSVYVFRNEVGRLKLMSKWDDANKRLNLLAKSNLNGNTTLTATGYYKPDSTYLNMNASLEDLAVSYFEPFLDDLVSKSKGKLSGELFLQGPLDKLSLTGKDCRFKDFGFTVDYTQVPYNLEGPVELNERGIFFKNLPISDNFGGKGTVNGALTYNYFRDLAVNVKVDFTNMQALNTTERDNEYFYGSAFATGSIDIKGPLEKISLDINVLSNAKTAIHIPLSSSVTATQTNLLTFVKPNVWIDPYDTLGFNKTTVSNPTQLDVQLKANLTPQADIMIEINKSVGDVIKANGNGLINLDINPEKDVFDIFGDYHVNTGSYKFVLAGFAAKDFTLQPGGTINFNGALDATTLNLDAVYHTKASINTLIADTSSVSTRRNVDCIIEMDGRMMNPELNFKINIPDLDPTTKMRVESALGNQGKIQKQFMALLVSGGFIPDEQSGIANNSSLLYSNASEILSNQINNIFHQLGIPLDLGLNYQPGDRGTNIFDVAVSTQLFNNRVLINGNIGNDPYGNNNRDVIGNIDVEIKLDNPGNLRLNVFSHAEDQYSSYNDNNNSQRSGVGIVYQREFNSFKNLIRGKSKAQKAYEKQERQKRREAKKNENHH